MANANAVNFDGTFPTSGELLSDTSSLKVYNKEFNVCVLDDSCAISKESDLTRQIRFDFTNQPASNVTWFFPNGAGNLQLPSGNKTLATLDGTETFTGKTLTGNIAVDLVSGGATITLPTTTGTLATLANAETFSNKVLSGNTASNFINGGATVTLPTVTSTLATVDRKLVVVAGGSVNVTTAADIYFVNVASPVTFNLPAVTATTTVYKFKDMIGTAATNNITISGLEPIDGNVTYVMNSNYQSITIESNGTNWSVI